MIEITTTATQRPELLERCYASFCRNISGLSESTLYLQIDPVPPNGQKQQVIDVAKRYFAHVVTHTPDIPNFPLAVKWCWAQPMGQWFLHLEDDWELTEPVDLDALVRLVASHPPFWNRRVVGLCLRAYPLEGEPCLTPSIVNTQWAKSIQFDAFQNPEMVIRQQRDRIAYVHWPKDAGHPIVRDIGREWMSHQPYYRKPGFVQWGAK